MNKIEGKYTPIFTCDSCGESLSFDDFKDVEAKFSPLRDWDVKEREYHHKKCKKNENTNKGS